MKFLIDMNLSPDWIDTFQEKGFQAVHWSSVGALNAPDEEIMEYALSNEYIVFTHDLDFGDILAATGAKGPSVIQVRTNNISPESLKVVLFDPDISPRNSFLSKAKLKWRRKRT